MSDRRSEPPARQFGNYTIEGVIFDMDGVVVDSEPLHEAAQAQIFEEYALPVPVEEYSTFKGRPERDVFAYILAKYDPEGAIDAAEIIEQKHAVYRDLLRTARPVAGAIEFIQLTAGVLPVGLTTSAAGDEQRFVFELFGLNGYFDFVISADDIVRAKPHPDPYLRTLEGLSLPAARVLVIEDSVLGVESALAAGCLVAGLVGTFDAATLGEAGAHMVVDSFTDLIRMWG